MIDFLLILIILIASGVAFNLQARHDARSQREALRRERIEHLYGEPQYDAYDAAGDARTIDLIGEEEYHKMTERIDSLLRRHGHQPCLTLNLTCGPDTDEGADELHHILPGMPLRLNLCSEGGVQWVDVYYNGARIGRLALLESMTLRDAMRHNHIRGAYVAEQNCFGIEDSHMLAIIVFYEPKHDTENVGLAFPGKETATGRQAIDISLN